ncbi:MAG: aldo/keto reductase [Dehalococcoidia bacterium]
MKYRTLGRTGLKVSEVGFGGGGIGGVWGETTENEGIRAVHRAIELGVNFFDVAPGYGSGRAEEVLGKALHDRRSDVLITTKASIRPQWLANISGFVDDSLSASLKRLQTDHVDLLLIHNAISARTGHPFESCITADQAIEMANAFVRHKEAGRVRFIGFTGWRCNRTELLKMLDSDLFDAFQTEYNILNQTAAVSVPEVGAVDMAELESESNLNMRVYSYIPVDQHLTIQEAQKRNLGVIGIRPILAGVLSNEIDRTVEDWTQIGVMQERARSLSFLAQPGRSLATAAFRFCLMNEGLSTIVPGVKKSSEIEEAVAAADSLPLSADELNQIDRLYRRNFKA